MLVLTETASDKTGGSRQIYLASRNVGMPLFYVKARGSFCYVSALHVLNIARPAPSLDDGKTLDVLGKNHIGETILL